MVHREKVYNCTYSKKKINKKIKSKKNFSLNNIYTIPDLQHNRHKITFFISHIKCPVNTPKHTLQN